MGFTRKSDSREFAGSSEKRGRVATRTPRRAFAVLGRFLWASTGLALFLSLGLGMAWAPNARASQTCQGSGSLPIFPASDIGGDSALEVGEGLDITVCLFNTSTIVIPPFTQVAAQLGGDTCSLTACVISGKSCTTDTDCTVEVTVILACKEGACNSPLPGTLSFLGFTDLTGGKIQDCSLDLTADPLGNTVVCTFKGGAANAVAIGPGAQVCFFTLDTEAVNPVVSTDIDGTFFKKLSNTGGLDIGRINDALCIVQEPFGAQGVTSCTFPAPTPDLSVTKIDSGDPVVVSESFTYTVTVTNNDASFDATNVVLTDTLPAGVSLVSTTGCAEDPNGVPTCTLGTINASTSAVVTITVNADTDGLATNSASVSADGTDPNPANDTANETTLLIDEASTWFFTGTAEGGTIDFIVNGVSLQVITTAGQSSAQVAAAIAAAINADPTLTTAGVGAVADGNSIITNGNVADTVINDAGLTHTAVPALSLRGALLALLLLALFGAAGLSRERRRRVASA